jgi:hypothetical protein
MKNKTCGECKWFVLNSEGQCRSIDGEENANNDCCSFFEPKVITNGDKLRQMSDAELVATIEELSLRFTGKSEFIAWLKQEAKDE